MVTNLLNRVLSKHFAAARAATTQWDAEQQSARDLHSHRTVTNRQKRSDVCGCWPAIEATKVRDILAAGVHAADTNQLLPTRQPDVCCWVAADLPAIGGRHQVTKRGFLGTETQPDEPRPARGQEEPLPTIAGWVPERLSARS